MRLGIGCRLTVEWTPLVENPQLFYTPLASTITYGAAPQISAQANQGTAGGALAQSNSSYRPITSTSGGIDSVYYVSDRMVNNLSKEATNWMHDGSGCTIIIVAKHNTLASSDCLFGTCRPGTPNTQLGLRYHVGATGIVTVQCSGANASGYVFDLASGAGVIDTTLPHITVIRHSTAYGRRVEVDNADIFALAPYSYATSGADSSYDLTIGDDPNFGMQMDAHLFEFWARNEVISDAKVVKYCAWAHEKYGVVLP